MNLLGITVIVGLVALLAQRSPGKRRIGEFERLRILTWAADRDIALCLAHGAEMECHGLKSRLTVFGQDDQGIKRRYVLELNLFGKIALIENKPLRLPRWMKQPLATGTAEVAAGSS